MKEDKCYLFFNGYYSVAAASDTLMRFRIENRIVKAPIYMRGSCSFAVMVGGADLQMCKMVLKDRMTGVRCENNNI